jgi:hypothetical protein
VKTRLARAIGDEAAAALYARLARHIVERCTWPARYCTAIWYDPPGAGGAVRAWLGRLEVAAFLPQRGRGLGARLRAGFDTYFRRGARRVVLVGSDCPAVDRGLVTEAFGALRRHEVVLGPSEDGGYYLIGLTGPAPRLFRGVAWSTGAVFHQTLQNARAAGLRVATLAPRRDIDTVEDARVLGWLPPGPAAASALLTRPGQQD